MPPFNVPVFIYPKDAAGNVHKIQVGTVPAEYLKDKHGRDVIDPDTKRPYIVPKGYKLENTIQEFTDAAKHTRFTSIDDLLKYRTDGSRDLQRHFNGVSYGGFVPDFTPIASFDVGIACRAAEWSIQICKMGGGAVNIRSAIKNDNINISGEYFNNPKNARNMDNANQYFDQNYDEESFIEQYFKIFKQKAINILGENDPSETPPFDTAENLSNPLPEHIIQNHEASTTTAINTAKQPFSRETAAGIPLAFLEQLQKENMEQLAQNQGINLGRSI